MVVTAPYYSMNSIQSNIHNRTEETKKNIDGNHCLKALLYINFLEIVIIVAIYATYTLVLIDGFPDW